MSDKREHNKAEPNSPTRRQFLQVAGVGSVLAASSLIPMCTSRAKGGSDFKGITAHEMAALRSNMFTGEEKPPSYYRDRLEDLAFIADVTRNPEKYGGATAANEIMKGYIGGKRDLLTDERFMGGAGILFDRDGYAKSLAQSTNTFYLDPRDKEKAKDIIELGTSLLPAPASVVPFIMKYTERDGSFSDETVLKALNQSATKNFFGTIEELRDKDPRAYKEIFEKTNLDAELLKHHGIDVKAHTAEEHMEAMRKDPGSYGILGKEVEEGGQTKTVLDEKMAALFKKAAEGNLEKSEEKELTEKLTEKLTGALAKSRKNAPKLGKKTTEQQRKDAIRARREIEGGVFLASVLADKVFKSPEAAKIITGVASAAFAIDALQTMVSSSTLGPIGMAAGLVKIGFSLVGLFGGGDEKDPVMQMFEQLQESITQLREELQQFRKEVHERLDNIIENQKVILDQVQQGFAAVLDNLDLQLNALKEIESKIDAFAAYEKSEDREEAIAEFARQFEALKTEIFDKEDHRSLERAQEAMENFFVHGENVAYSTPFVGKDFDRKGDTIIGRVQELQHLAFGMRLLPAVYSNATQVIREYEKKEHAALQAAEQTAQKAAEQTAQGPEATAEKDAAQQVVQSEAPQGPEAPAEKDAAKDVAKLTATPTIGVPANPIELSRAVQAFAIGADQYPEVMNMLNTERAKILDKRMESTKDSLIKAVSRENVEQLTKAYGLVATEVLEEYVQAKHEEFLKGKGISAEATAAAEEAIKNDIKNWRSKPDEEKNYLDSRRARIIDAWDTASPSVAATQESFEMLRTDTAIQNLQREVPDLEGEDIDIGEGPYFLKKRMDLEDPRNGKTKNESKVFNMGDLFETRSGIGLLDTAEMMGLIDIQITSDSVVVTKNQRLRLNKDKTLREDITPLSIRFQQGDLEGQTLGTYGTNKNGNDGFRISRLTDLRSGKATTVMYIEGQGGHAFKDFTDKGGNTLYGVKNTHDFLDMLGKELNKHHARLREEFLAGVQEDISSGRVITWLKEHKEKNPESGMPQEQLNKKVEQLKTLSTSLSFIAGLRGWLETGDANYGLLLAKEPTSFGFFSSEPKDKESTDNTLIDALFKRDKEERAKRGYPENIIAAHVEGGGPTQSPKSIADHLSDLLVEEVQERITAYSTEQYIQDRPVKIALPEFVVAYAQMKGILGGPEQSKDQSR